MKKNDIILIVILIVIAFITGIIFTFNKSSGKTVTIYVDGKPVKELSLSRDTEYSVDSEYGHNTITIKDGYVYVSDSDCKNHICMKTGKISSSEETIVCLPHKLIVKISE